MINGILYSGVVIDMLIRIKDKNFAEVNLLSTLNVYVTRPNKYKLL